MSAASFLNEVGEKSSGYRNFDTLAQGQPYKVHSFSTYESNAFNKERTCVQVHIDDGYLFLPSRYDDCFDQLKSLNTRNLYIIYHGRKGASNRLEIEFKEIIDDSAAAAGVDTNKNKNKNQNPKKNNNNKKARYE